MRADQLRADAVGRFAEVADRGAGLLARSIAPAPAASRPAGAARRRCPAGRPCARRRAAGSRRWPARRRSAPPASGAGTPLALATARGHVGQRLRPRRWARRVDCVRQRHQPVVVRPHAGRCTCAPCAPPGAGAARTADGPCAGSEPTTSTRSQRSTAPRSACPASATPCSRVAAKSAWRRRWSMLSLPRPRTSLRQQVQFFHRAVRAEPARRCVAAPCSALICFRPLATYSSAVVPVDCPATAPPCLSIGCGQALVGCSAPRSEKRSRSAIQHSLTSSFSSGTHAHHLVVLDLHDQVGAGAVVRADATCGATAPRCGRCSGTACW